MALGLYVHRHQPDWKHSDYNPTLAFPIPEAPWINQHADTWRDLWGTTFDVTGTGFGCTVIHRRVLEAVQFRLHTFGGRWIPNDCDTHFYDDVLNGGFTVKCDTTVVCGHRRPDGMILWPGQHATTLTPGLMNRTYHMEYLNGTASA